MTEINTVMLDEKRHDRLHVDRLPRNEFGQALLDDKTTNREWWDLRDDHEPSDTRLNVVLADLDPYQPAMMALDIEEILPEGVRVPDLFDDGMAFWLTGRAVVACEVERLRSIDEVLAKPRLRYNNDGLGWVRIHPSAYGVDVDSFFTHNGEPAPHSAHEAWDLLTEAVRA